MNLTHIPPRTILLGCGCAAIALSVGCVDAENSAEVDESRDASAELAAQPQWLTTLSQAVGEPVVVTPSGVLPARCVIEIGDTDRLDLERGVVAHADGTARVLSTCGVPPLRATGIPVERAQGAGAVPPPATSGWVENANLIWGSDMRKLSATWRVPSAPTRGVGQTIYLFPAMENLNGTTHILQPVLGWHDGWTLASWWGADSNGNYFHSTPIAAAPNDLIYGVIHGESCSTNCDWWVTSENLALVLLVRICLQNFLGASLERYKTFSCLLFI